MCACGLVEGGLLLGIIVWVLFGLGDVSLLVVFLVVYQSLGVDFDLVVWVGTYIRFGFIVALFLIALGFG